MFLVDLYISIGPFGQNFGNVKIVQSTLTIVRPFFRVNLSNSFGLEAAIMEVFEVAESESVVKIEVAPFSDALGPIFARNLGITRQGWVERARQGLLPVSR